MLPGQDKWFLRRMYVDPESSKHVHTGPCFCYILFLRHPTFFLLKSWSSTEHVFRLTTLPTAPRVLVLLSAFHMPLGSPFTYMLEEARLVSSCFSFPSRTIPLLWRLLARRGRMEYSLSRLSPGSTVSLERDTDVCKVWPMSQKI